MPSKDLPRIRIPSVCERDVDVLLLEEAIASPGFLKWLLGKADIHGRFRLVSAGISVNSPSGESDLELFVKSRTKTWGVLIEDKLDAQVQPRQAQRYQERAQGYITGGRCHDCRTVIVAPRKYFAADDGSKGFEIRIDMEDILTWFDRSRTAKTRVRYIQALLRAAIERGCIGWQLIRDPIVTDFWQRYWEFANSVAPEFGMPRPKEKPSKSTFIYFDPPDLPARINLVHKLDAGFMDLQFEGMAKNIAELRMRYRRRLGKNMFIECAGKSAVVRISVDKIDVTRSFTDSTPSLRRAIKEGKRLLALYRRVEGAEASGRIRKLP